MSGDDSVTDTDALKVLNTEIMAGTGPDVLLLDGISEDTYIERGMLENLSGVLKRRRYLAKYQRCIYKRGWKHLYHACQVRHSDDRGK